MNATPPFYHRLISANPGERDLVATTGRLEGRMPAMIAGNAGPRVKAYVGRLPDGENGYTFTTDVEPSNLRRFSGNLGAEWREGAPGVHSSEKLDTVWIEVEVQDD